MPTWLTELNLKRYTLIAVCYMLFLYLESCMWLEPEHIGPINFRIGLAVGLYLIEGYKILPVLLLLEGVAATFCLHSEILHNTYEIITLLVSVKMLGLLIQLVLTHRYMKSRKYYPSSLESPRDVLYYYISAGFLFSWVQPLLVSTAQIIFANYHTETNTLLAYMSMVHWVSIAIGVTLVAPLVHYLNQHESIEHNRSKIVILTIFTTTFSVLLYLNERNNRRLMENEFKEDVMVYSRLIQERLTHIEHSLMAIKGFFESSERMTQDKFNTFIKQSFPNQPLIQAYAWSPKILQQDRAAYEKQSRSEGLPDFSIKAYNSSQKISHAHKKDYYFPIDYLVPYSGNESLLGFDIASVPSFTKMLDEAWAYNSIGTSSFSKLFNHENEILFILPVYIRESQANMSRLNMTRGILQLIVRTDRIFQSPKTPQIKHPINILVNDMAQGIDNQLSDMQQNPIANIKLKRPFSIGQYQWQITYTPSFSFMYFWVFKIHLALYFIGYLFTLLSSVFILTLLGQNALIKKQVQDKTEELNANIDLLKLFFKQTPVEMAMFDNHMRYLMVSHQWCQYYQLNEKNIIGRVQYEVIPDLMRLPEVIEMHRKVLAGAPHATYEFLWEGTHSKSCWIKLSTHPWRFANGHIGGLIQFSQDMTEEKFEDASKKLQLEASRIIASHLSLNDVLSRIIQVICTSFNWDFGATWIRAHENDYLNCAQIWTHLENADEFISFTRQYKCSERDGLLGTIWKQKQPIWIRDLKQAKPFPRIHQTQKLDLHSGFGFPIMMGDRIVLIVECFSIKMQPPNPALLKAIKQIGLQLGHYLKRREAEIKLKDSEASKSAILNSTQDGIFTFSIDGKILSYNRRFSKLFKIIPQQSLSITHLLPEISQKIKKIPQEIILEFRRVLDGEEPFFGEISLSLIPNSKRRVYVGVIRDVTERKVMDQMKNDLVANVNHEIRTPLTSIRGSLVLLTKSFSTLSPEAEELLEIARNNCERLIRLVNSMLDIEKIEAGKMHINCIPLDLNELLSEALKQNAGYAKPCDIKITYHAPKEKLYVEGDFDRLMQVMTNLLSNAIKFSPIGGMIDIKTQADTDFVIVYVIDHGDGIPDQFKDHVFEKFSQARSTSTPAREGTGLGLAITKSLIEAMGGDIGFESRDVTGTVFYFKLRRISHI